MLATEELQERIRQAPARAIAARIRTARKEYGSHDSLAVAVGTSRQHLIKLEKGQHRPGAPMLIRIAAATGREVDWFIEDRNPFLEAA